MGSDPQARLRAFFDAYGETIAALFPDCMMGFAALNPSYRLKRLQWRRGEI
jgi:hypothetical protein